jgi:K+-sensing histidine kinase KdpD
VNVRRTTIGSAYNDVVNASPSHRLTPARLTLVGGPLLAIAVAASTASLRDEVGASNVGIALALAVVAAALVDRWAGLVSAAAAALSFNFFHTKPYHSLRIDNSSDVVIVALLAALGLVVSDITAWRQRRDTIARRRHRAIGAPLESRALLAESRPVAEVWPAIVSSILDQLSLAEVSFTREPIGSLPVIARVTARHSTDDDGFVLPAGGAAIAVVADGHQIGHVVLRPTKGVTSLWVERRIVVALADHIGLALTYGDAGKQLHLLMPH